MLSCERLHIFILISISIIMSPLSTAVRSQPGLSDIWLNGIKTECNPSSHTKPDRINQYFSAFFCPCPPNEDVSPYGGVEKYYTASGISALFSIAVRPPAAPSFPLSTDNINHPYKFSGHQLHRIETTTTCTKRLHVKHIRTSSMHL